MTSLKNLDQLTVEINQAVHVNGPLGKTTAPGLNAVLQSLAAELTTLPQVVGAGGVQACTYAEAQARQAAGSLQPGAYYLVGERPTAALGSSGDVLVQAAAADALAPEALLCTRVPDYAGVPLWRTDYLAPGTATGTSYAQATSPYVAVAPRFFDTIDRHIIGNDSVFSVALPFTFTLGGVDYSAATIDTNGRMVLGPGLAASSYHQQRMGTTDTPIIAFAWHDMTTTAATFRSFVTGDAPHRRLVLEYQHAPRQGRYFLSGVDYNVADVVSGQLVLEETTNRLTIGMASNLNPDTDVVQGIQYAGHGYNLYEGQMLPSGVMTTFTPVTDRSAPVLVVVPADQTVVWKGQTWTLATGGAAADEPGTSPAWVPATGTHRDAFGNALPTYDRVTYDLATDALHARTDAAGNVVRRPGGGDFGTFPWGRPGVVGNELTATTLDTSLLTVAELQFAGNRFTDSALARVNLAGVACTDNVLHGVSLADYTPTQLDHVAAYFGFDQQVTAASHQVFVNGVAVRSEVGIVEAGFTAFKDHYVDASFTTYRAGQAPSYEPLDLFDTTNTDFTPHDLIVVRGSFVGRPLCLRNQDYYLSGPATFGAAFFGAAARGLNITVKNLTFKEVFYIFPATVEDKSHHIRVENCTLAYTQYAGGGNGQLNTYAFAQCAIGRMANLNGQPYQGASFEGCTFGVGITQGSIFGGGRDAGNGSLVIANSLVLLQGTATLYDNNTPPANPPIFQNVTVVAADGTVSVLGGTSTSTTVAVPTEIATSPVLFVQGYGQTLLGQRGNAALPFPTIQAAIDAASDYDTIVVLPGGKAVDAAGRHCYDEAVNVTKSVTIAAVGTVVCTGAWILPQYPYADRGYTHVLKGLIFRNYVAMVVPRGGALDVRFEDCIWEEGGYIFSLQGITTTPQVGADIATFVRCRFNTTLPAGSDGPFKFQGRDDSGYVKDIDFYLKDCEVVAANTPVATGHASVRQRIHLQGTTTLTPGAGQPLIGTTRVNSSVPLTFSELFVDERPSVGGVGSAGLEVIAVATLAGNLSANGFNTLPITSLTLDVRPAGTTGGWDQPNNAYVVPLTGTYELQTKARIDDAAGPVGGNYALGAGPLNIDGPWVAWNTIAQTTATNRKGHQNTRILHLSVGEVVHQYLYLDGFDAYVGGELSIKLLRRD